MTKELALAYTHPKISREAFLAELQRHEDQDSIIAGKYSTTTPSGKFSGCAVGYSLHSVKIVAGIKNVFDYTAHNQYPIYLGIPESLAWLQDKIFENLPAPAGRKFPMQFSSAIQARADLSGVRDKISNSYATRDSFTSSCEETA